MKNKLLTNLLLLPVVLLLGSSAFAQIAVSGTVSDANGPVPGVNVVVDGTSIGAQTDFDGNYSVGNVANDATLVFSTLVTPHKKLPLMVNRLSTLPFKKMRKH